MTVDVAHIRRLYDYHHWANALIYEPVSSLSAADLDKPWGGSFGTGRALLRHIVGVERLWIDRWNGISGKAPDYPATHGGKDFRAEWEKVKPDQQKFIAALTDAIAAADLTYVNTKGETWTYGLADLLVHVVNHGTYHRGQVAQLLRDFGRQPPSTDYLYYIQALRKK